MNPAIIGLGALNVDRIYHVKKVLTDGETAIDSAGAFAGGSAANTIYGLARLGLDTGFCGAVGDDAGGRLLLGDFKKVGADISHITIKAGLESGTVFCLSSGAERSLYVMPGANSALASEDIDLDYLNRAAWLHLTSFVDEDQFELSQEIASALDNRTKLSFSPGSLYVERGLEALLPILRRTDVLLINRREIEILTGRDFKTGVEECHQAGCKTVAVTLGAGLDMDGEISTAYISDGREKVWISAGAAEHARIDDTTGAGDAFAAGFLFGMLSGCSAITCGQYGHTIARLSLRYYGARKGLPTGSQLLKEHHKLYGNNR